MWKLWSKQFYSQTNNLCRNEWRWWSQRIVFIFLKFFICIFHWNALNSEAFQNWNIELFIKMRFLCLSILILVALPTAARVATVRVVTFWADVKGKSHREASAAAREGRGAQVGPAPPPQRRRLRTPVWARSILRAPTSPFGMPMSYADCKICHFSVSQVLIPPASE